jgi:hypothetical protein
VRGIAWRDFLIWNIGPESHSIEAGVSQYTWLACLTLPITSVAEGSPLDITINNLNVIGDSSANSTLATEHMPRIQGKIVAKVGNASVQWSPYASQDEVGSSHSITFPFVYLVHSSKVP